MTKHYAPLEDRVLVEPEDVGEYYDAQGLLKRPASSKEMPQRGVVRAVGPAAQALEVGDVVVFGRYAGVAVELEGKELLIMRQSDVLAKVRESDECAH